MEQEERHRPAAAVCERRRRERRARRRCAARGEGAARARREGEEAQHRSSGARRGQGAPRLLAGPQLSIGSSALAANLSSASTGLPSLPSLTSLHLEDSLVRPPSARSSCVPRSASLARLTNTGPRCRAPRRPQRARASSFSTPTHPRSSRSLARDCARARASPRSARPSRPLPLTHTTRRAPAAAPPGRHATSTTARRPTNAAGRRMSSHTRC
jgi:hypothetical protein